MKKNKRLILIILIATIILFIRFADFNKYLTFKNLQDNKYYFKEIVQENYLLSVLMYIILYIFIAGLSIPGAAILTLSGGFLFGTILGAIYVNLGATTGALIAFLFSRYLIGNWIQRKYHYKLIKFNKELSYNGYLYLLTLRFIPISPFFLINIFSSLTNVSLKTFTWTTSLGILPCSLVYTFAGNQLNSIESVKDIFSRKMLIAFLLLALFTISPIIFNHIKRKEQKK